MEGFGTNCRYCGKWIYMLQKDDKWRPMQHANHNTYHMCQSERNRREEIRQSKRATYLKANPGLAKAKRSIEALDAEMDMAILRG